MATNYTPIIVGAAANADTFNDPLDELDAAIKKNNWIATSAPGVNHDALAGYSVGSRWVDITNDIAYTCVDATTGAAIWLQASVTSGTIPAHDIVGARHSITGAQYSLVGATALDTLGLLTPSADVSAGATAILRSNAGALTLAGLTIGGLTASTLIYSSAGKAIVSLANSGAQSYLSNNGSGTLAWTAGTPAVGGGSGAATRVAFWSDASTLTSDADMTFVTDTLTATKVNASTSFTIASGTYYTGISSNPGAAARVLASDSAGALQLKSLGLNTAPLATAGTLQTSASATTSYPGGYASTTYNVQSVSVTPGGSSPSGGAWIAASYTMTFNNAGLSDGATYAQGLNAIVNIYGSSGGSLFWAQGLLGDVNHWGTFNPLSNAYGGVFYSRNRSTGLISYAAGFYARVLNYSTGTISTAVGAAIDGFYNPSGTIVTAYGIKVENQTAASTNYAIYTGSGLNRLGDQLSIVGSADRIQLIVKANATQTTNLIESQNSSGTVQLALAGNGRDLILDTTTGSKICTATSQKLAFWNATPIVQPTTAVAAATFVANTSGIVNDTATWDGYTIGQVVKALRNEGLLA